MLENSNITTWVSEHLLEWVLSHGIKIIIIIIVGTIIGRVLHYVIEGAVRKAVTPSGFSSKLLNAREKILLRKYYLVQHVCYYGLLSL